MWPHVVLQLAALPVSESTVHASLSSQVAGQVEIGSQVSPASTVPFPQVVEQSESPEGSHPAGQQASPAAHATMVVDAQDALQF